MTDAKLGLIIVTVLIGAMALLLHRKGALSGAAGITAFCAALAIATALFLVQ